MCNRSQAVILLSSTRWGEAVTDRIGNHIELLIALAREVHTFGPMSDAAVALDGNV